MTGPYQPYPVLGSKTRCQAIWFNAWEHQFETTPLVALLHTLRDEFSRQEKAAAEGKKLLWVAGMAILDSAAAVAKGAGFSAPDGLVSGIEKRGKQHEAERFDDRLASERFRTLLDAAVKTVAGEDGRLIVFVDDLDRCEGEVAFRLLEALKLYLNTPRMIFVLGMDASHLETVVSGVLTRADTASPSSRAREYLQKMFQQVFTLPMPDSAAGLIRTLIPEDLCRMTGAALDDLVLAADRNLEHNPRKIKSFINAWHTYHSVLHRQRMQDVDWKIVFVLTYLQLFEPPLFRALELEQPPVWSRLLAVAEARPVAETPYCDLRAPELPDDWGAAVGPADEDLGGTLSSASERPTAPTRSRIELRVLWPAELLTNLGIKALPNVKPHLIAVRHS